VSGIFACTFGMEMFPIHITPRSSR